jgi:hypothetical protein
MNCTQASKTTGSYAVGWCKPNPSAS